MVQRGGSSLRDCGRILNPTRLYHFTITDPARYLCQSPTLQYMPVSSLQQRGKKVIYIYIFHLAKKKSPWKVLRNEEPVC